MSENFVKGDKILVISGRYEGRTGHIQKLCSPVFKDFIHVEFDLRPRERVAKTAMIEIIEIQHHKI